MLAIVNCINCINVLTVPIPPFNNKDKKEMSSAVQLR